MKECYGIVYRFTHKISGKWYIGSHCKNGKKYTGSGVYWANAKIKHGLESFSYEVLYEGNNCREMEELVLMTLGAKDDPMSFNLKNEAVGGAFFGESNGMFGKTHSEETKRKIGDNFRGKKRPEHSENMKGDKNPMFGRNDHCSKIIEYGKSCIGKTFDEIHGAEASAIIKQKLSVAHKGIPKPNVSIAQSGSNNSSAKKIIINGVTYGCITDAMAKLNLSRYKIKQICEEVKL